jgi:hypothetical protein
MHPEYSVPNGWTSTEIDYLTTHWLTKTDAEIAHRLKKSLSAVRRSRYLLGLKCSRQGRKGGVKNWNPRKAKISRDSIDFVAVETMLTVGGRTISDVAHMLTDRGVRISREWLRQLCCGEGINTKKRPEWYAARFGLPQLASRAWLRNQLQKRKGAYRLSLHLGECGTHITPSAIRNQALRLDIEKSLLPYPTVFVQLECDFCGVSVKKRPYWVRPGQQYVFCSNTCKGKWLGSGAWKHSEKVFLTRE